MLRLKTPLSAIKANKTAIAYFTTVIVCLLLFACAANNALVQSSKSTTQSADGSRIVYGISGQGEPTIVFVHGWLCDHTTWKYQIDYFSKSYRVIWLDLAGHGDSEANRQRFTMSAFAQDVESVVNTANGEKIILVGHSMGGPIVIEAAKLIGEKVIGIVGVDAFYTPLSAVPEEMKLKFVEKLKTDYPTALAWTVNSMFSENASQDLIDSTYNSMLADNHKMGISALYECIKWNSKNEQLELRNFSNKLYNINGAPTVNGKILHENVVLIPDVGHFVHLLKPDEFNAALEMVIERY